MLLVRSMAVRGMRTMAGISLQDGRQGVTIVMTGGWDTVQLPISANNYFAIASPVTPTTNYWSGGANAPVSVHSVKTDSIIIALPGGNNQWKASILIIGTVQTGWKGDRP